MFQRLAVTFAAAPEGVTRAAELVRYLERLLHLRGGVGKDIGVWAGGCAVAKARVCKQIGGAPEELDSRALLLFLEDLHDRIEIFVRFRETCAFRRDIAIVKRVKGSAEFLDELEGDARPIAGVLHRVRAIIPRADGRARTERIAENVPERVPVGDGEAKVIGHRLSLDDFLGVVMFEGERVFGFRTLVGDLLYVGKCRLHKADGKSFSNFGQTEAKSPRLRVRRSFRHARTADLSGSRLSLGK